MSNKKWVNLYHLWPNSYNIWRQDLLKSSSCPFKNTVENIYMYTSWVNWDIYGGNKYWFLVEDTVTVILWSRFEINNTDLTNELLPIICHIQSIHPIKFIHCEKDDEKQEL